jgi:hypothetical protein
MIIHSLEIANRGTVVGSVTVGEKILALKITFSDHPPIRTLSVSAPTKDETVQIHYAPEFKSLCKMIWQVIDGGVPAFPVEVREEL